MNLADAATVSAPQPPNVVRDFEQADGDRFQVPAGFHDRVLGPLRFEMVFGFAKFDSGALFEMPHHFAGKLEVPV